MIRSNVTVFRLRQTHQQSRGVPGQVRGQLRLLLVHSLLHPVLPPQGVRQPRSVIVTSFSILY